MHFDQNDLSLCNWSFIRLIYLLRQLITLFLLLSHKLTCTSLCMRWVTSCFLNKYIKKRLDDNFDVALRKICHYVTKYFFHPYKRIIVHKMLLNSRTIFYLSSYFETLQVANYLRKFQSKANNYPVFSFHFEYRLRNEIQCPPYIFYQANEIVHVLF